MTFIVLCLYSLLGQTFKLKEFDFLLYYIIFHIMFSLFRQVFFFATYDKELQSNQWFKGYCDFFIPKKPWFGERIGLDHFLTWKKYPKRRVPDFQQSAKSHQSTKSHSTTVSSVSSRNSIWPEDEHGRMKGIKDTWCVMRFEIFSFMNLIQFLVLITGKSFVEPYSMG